MFTTPFADSTRSPHIARAAHAYANTGVTTAVTGASPHRLIEMLFDGFADAVARARGAIREGDIEQKSKYINKALRIIDEGLKCSLDLQAGGELAGNLQSLYGFVIMRLSQANLHNDEDMLDDCLSVIAPIHEAWVAIRPKSE